MNVYTCTQFSGVWPVGTAAVVYADNQDEAAKLLNIELQEQGLPGDAEPKDMEKFPKTKRSPEVRVLRDGDY